MKAWTGDTKATRICRRPKGAEALGSSARDRGAAAANPAALKQFGQIFGGVLDGRGKSSGDGDELI